MPVASLVNPVGAPGKHAPEKGVVARPVQVRVCLLTGGQDRPYAFGLAMALAAKGAGLDVVGSDEVDSPEFHHTSNLRFINVIQKRRMGDGAAKRLGKLLLSYVRLIHYSATSDPGIFHILWNNRIEYFDRTLVMIYFKALGKKIVMTAHNVNQGRRDSNDSLLNRLTLRIQYRLSDHIFVHTQKMKDELAKDFGVRQGAVTVIRHPINDAFPDTNLTPAEAKRRLGLALREKVILFFGRLRPYKGLEYLLCAFQQVAARGEGFRLIIAGESKKGSEAYYNEIQEMIKRHPNREQIIQRVQFIPDSDIELYFKAADVLALPYKEIFQSGVLFLAYSFGLPVVAADVGSFKEEIIEGETGCVCKPCDPADLAGTLETYFESDLFKNLVWRREEIRRHAFAQHSWGAVAEKTQRVYRELSGVTTS